MTQLGELRDAWPAFQEAGIKLYAISYDDVEALAAFARAHGVLYPLLSDADSEAIRRYGILNTLVEAAGGPLYGIPFPGTYIVDEDGIVVEKFFNDTYKKRESAETLIDAALGRILLRVGEPVESAGDDDVCVTVTVHGGGGAIKQGAVRHVVARFELGDGMHIYGEPVPERMVATTVEVSGPDGLVIEEPILPTTEPLRLEGLGVELQAWTGVVDIVVPVYALSSLASELRPLGDTEATVAVTVRYQACNNRICLTPRSETLSLSLPIEPLDVPNLPLFVNGGQRQSEMDSRRHLRRLAVRKLRSNPLRFVRFLLSRLRLELAARRRSTGGGTTP